jgi:methyltransferase (TIGR00027 family)
MEYARPDRLISDPWASALAGDVGAAWIVGRSADRVAPIVLRTRYFDDFLQRIVTEHGLRQVVLLASGLDTRAYRLAWPEATCIYELDQQAVLEHKATVLARANAQPTCDHRIIAADLVGDWLGALAASGFDGRAPAVWLLEGFLFYLPSALLERVVDQVAAAAAPGCWLGFDVINSATLAHPYTQEWLAMQLAAGAPWIGTLDDPVGFLAARGWRASLTQAGQKDANHGRWSLPVFPTTMPGVPHNWFVTAVKDL